MRREIDREKTAWEITTRQIGQEMISQEGGKDRAAAIETKIIFYFLTLTMLARWQRASWSGDDWDLSEKRPTLPARTSFTLYHNLRLLESFALSSLICDGEDLRMSNWRGGMEEKVEAKGRGSEQIEELG